MDRKKRDWEIYSLRYCGATYSLIGAKYGLSRERIRQIVKNEKKRISKEEESKSVFLKQFSTRVFNCLCRSGLPEDATKEDFYRWVDSGEATVRNFGEQSKEEMNAVLDRKNKNITVFM